MYCRNCGKELPEGANFCTGCGTQIQSAPVADVQPAAVAKSMETQRVYAAANSVNGFEKQESADEVMREVVPVTSGNKKRGTVLIGLAIAGIVAVAAIVIGLVSLFGGNSADSMVYVNEDGELIFRPDLKKDSTTTILSDEASEATAVFFGDDGEYIYYVEREGYEEYGTFYVVKTADIDKKTVVLKRYLLMCIPGV